MTVTEPDGRSTDTDELAGRPDPALDLREVLDRLARAVVVTDPAGRIVLWSRSAEELFGWSESEVLGRSTADVLRELDDRSGIAELIDRAGAGSSSSGDAIVARPNDEPLRAFIIATPILARGQLSAIVIAAEDVTDVRVAEQRVRAARPPSPRR